MFITVSCIAYHFDQYMKLSCYFCYYHFIAACISIILLFCKTSSDCPVTPQTLLSLLPPSKPIRCLLLSHTRDLLLAPPPGSSHLSSVLLPSVPACSCPDLLTPTSLPPSEHLTSCCCSSSDPSWSLPTRSSRCSSPPPPAATGPPPVFSSVCLWTTQPNADVPVVSGQQLWWADVRCIAQRTDWGQVAFWLI